MRIKKNQELSGKITFPNNYINKKIMSCVYVSISVLYFFLVPNQFPVILY